MIRVYIDAGSAITRIGLESMLTSDPGIEIVHDASEADVVVGARRMSSRDVTAEQIIAAVHAAAAGLPSTPLTTRRTTNSPCQRVKPLF